MKYAVVIMMAGMLTACRSTKKIQSAISKKDTSSIVTVDTAGGKNDSVTFIHSILNDIAHNHINYKTFSGKINIDYKDAANKNYNLNAFVRMYKDSAIWISVNAIFGIEAMRVLVTKDSVKLLDKTNRFYTRRSIDYLQDVTELPLNLYTLQDLIIGNPVFLDKNIISYSKKGNTISLLSISKWFKNLLTINADNKTLQRSKLDDANIVRNRTADLVYLDYDSKQGVQFPTRRTITVAEKGKLDISLDFKQYDINPDISFPFPIPKNYKNR